MMIHYHWISNLGADLNVQKFVVERFAKGRAEGAFSDTPDGQVDLKEEAIIATAGRSPHRDILGFVTFYEIEGRKLWLHLLWTEPHARRMGVAWGLLQEVEKFAKDERLAGLLLGRMTTNDAMKRLMQKEGWSVDHIVHARHIPVKA